MKRKHLLLILLVTMIIPAGIPIARAAVKGTIALFPASVSWIVGSEPVPKEFDLTVEITNVTDCVAVTFSLSWDPSILNLTYINSDAPKDAYCLYNPGGGGTFFTKVINYGAGELHEAAYTQLATYTPKDFADPTWGLVADLTFEFVGTPPSIGAPIDTDIVFTNYDAGDIMLTYWAEKPNGLVSNNFTVMSSCHFHYEAQLMPRRRPVAGKIYTPTPPIWEGTTVNFFAGAPYSVGGCDGDTDPTPITTWIWDFGDPPGVNVTLGINTASHTYTTKGTYTVKLWVIAPKVGWASGDYINISLVHQETLNVLEKLGTYIDVVTEDERWPGYMALLNGTGAGQPADAYSPQENVTLYATVVYKGDVVQNKLVGFEVRGPTNAYWNITFGRENTTDTNGVATITFRIPWPCENAEDKIFGIWCVNVSVSLAEITYTDWLCFKVGWIVQILSLTTVNGTGAAKDVFKKTECIGVNITIHNNAMDDREALILFTVYDDVGAVICHYHIWMNITPGDWTLGPPAVTEFYCNLEIPKFAFCGENARVYANAFIDWPHAYGTPWCPEVSQGIIITPA